MKNLKIQCAEASMQASMARAFALTTPDGQIINSLKKLGQEKFEKLCADYNYTMETAVCEFPNHGQIIETMLRYPHEPKKVLETCWIKPVIPVKP